MEKNFSRRDFLKITGATVASLMLDKFGGAEKVRAEDIAKNGEEKEKIKIDWENFIYEFCKEDPEQIEKLKKILSEVWGSDFQSEIDFYDENDIEENSRSFISAGKYSFYSNEIKFNRFVLGETIRKKEPFRFLNTIFHESAHADLRKDDYCFLKNIANNLGLTEPETFDIIRHSKFLEADKRKDIERNILANQLINEIYATLGEVYVSFKINEKYSFPLEEFLANQALFNKINQSTPEEKEAFFYKCIFERSKYFSVEYLSLLLMENFGYDLEKARDFMKTSKFSEIASKITEVYYKSENKKINRMDPEIKNKVPQVLYNEMLESDNEILKEEEATSVFFEEFSEKFSQKNNLKKGLLGKKAQELKKNGSLKQLSVHIFDEVLTLKESFEKNIEKEMEEITAEEKELLIAVRDLYLIFRNGGHQEETKTKADSTVEKLKGYLENKSFANYASRIEEEITNVYGIYRNMFDIEGGFETRN